MTSLPFTKQHPLLRLLHYAKNYRWQIWTAVTFTIVERVFVIGRFYLIGVAVDVVVDPENSIIAQWGISNIIAQLVVLSLLTLLTRTLESLSEFIYDRLWLNLAHSIQHQLRVDGYNHLQLLELSYFEERSTGTLLSILNDDINQLEKFLAYLAAHILQIMTTIVAVSGSFLFIAPNVAWLAIRVSASQTLLTVGF
ncbi:ABC transporter transmembrane domain-containing protein [Nodularia chucula]|uniref:ABC transporter transmembrane domain-containing protein n=1 Tax=Nodularia chucula TaxID=3093667 RepID=UPI0039C60A92